jgi:hypothetical protein
MKILFYIACFTLGICIGGFCWVIMDLVNPSDQKEITVQIEYYNGDKDTIIVFNKPERLVLNDGCLGDYFKTPVVCGVRNFKFLSTKEIK